MNTPEYNEMQVFLTKIQAGVDRIAARCMTTPPGSFADKDADEVMKEVREAKSHIAAGLAKLTQWEEAAKNPGVRGAKPVRMELDEPELTGNPEKDHGNRKGKH